STSVGTETRSRVSTLPTLYVRRNEARTIVVVGVGAFRAAACTLVARATPRQQGRPTTHCGALTLDPLVWNTAGPGTRTVVVPRKTSGNEMARASAMATDVMTITTAVQDNLSPDGDPAVMAAGSVADMIC